MVYCLVKRCLLDWKPISDRIITARLQSKIRKVTLIQCYAPTETSTLEQKEDFYDALNTTISRVRRSEILILTGDFNAKVGADNSNLEDVMEAHGLGRMNQNGELFTDLCHTRNLVIGGTLFPHKRIHKVIWESPDHVTDNQIDHIANSRKWRKSLLNVRSYRGADVASVHHLVTAQIRIRLSAKKNTNIYKRTKFNTEKLKIPRTRDRFEERLNEELASANENQGISWNCIQNAIIKTSEEVG